MAMSNGGAKKAWRPTTAEAAVAKTPPPEAAANLLGWAKAKIADI
jgi:hypothetical protein